MWISLPFPPPRLRLRCAARRSGCYSQASISRFSGSTPSRRSATSRAERKKDRHQRARRGGNSVARVPQKAGFDVGRDITLLNTGADAVRYVSVVSGSTDATVITLPWNFSAEDAGLRNLVSFTKEDMVQLTGSVVDSRRHSAIRTQRGGKIHHRDHERALGAA